MTDKEMIERFEAMSNEELMAEVLEARTALILADRAKNNCKRYLDLVKQSLIRRINSKGRKGGALIYRSKAFVTDASGMFLDIRDVVGDPNQEEP